MNEQAFPVTKEATSSIALSRNSKAYVWDIKIYFDASSHEETEVAQCKVMTLDQWFKKNYGGDNDKRD